MDKKNVIIGVSSFVGGAIVGHFGPKLMNKVKSLVSSKLKKPETETKTEEKAPEEDKEDHSKPLKEDMSDPEIRKKELESRKKVVDEYKKQVQTYTPYHKFAQKQAEETEKTDDHPDDDTPFDDIPYSITADDYLHTCTSYEKVTWTYYMKDDTFADEHEKIIEDYEKFIGYCPDTFFDLGSDDPIYIRNERLSSDFEILKRRGSYKLEVLGEDDD